AAWRRAPRSGWSRLGSEGLRRRGGHRGRAGSSRVALREIEHLTDQAVALIWPQVSDWSQRVNARMSEPRAKEAIVRLSVLVVDVVEAAQPVDDGEVSFRVDQPLVAVEGARRVPDAQATPLQGLE